MLPPSKTCCCPAYRFPHRWLSGLCGDYHSDLRDHPSDEQPVCSLPGRSHFDSDADYWAAVNAR
jgi:hypothetical protein